MTFDFSVPGISNLKAFHIDQVGENMALPQSLRVSVTPPELELISCQQLVEIVPLISMEKTAFISVYILSFTFIYA